MPGDESAALPRRQADGQASANAKSSYGRQTKPKCYTSPSRAVTGDAEWPGGAWRRGVRVRIDHN